MPGGYAIRWTDTHRKYVMFARGQPHALAEELEQDLESLEEEYYTVVRRYLNVARMSKARPEDATLKQELKATEEKLCSEDMRRSYYSAAVAALNCLASVAEAVSTYIKGSGPSGEQSQPIKDLLNELKSISDELKKDLEAYVTKPLSTLLALRAVGGTENLPPTPGT
jgi:hypothetical protein